MRGKVKPARIDILEFPEFAVTNQFFELQHGGVVPEQMPHHKDTPEGLRGVYHQQAVTVGRRERFLDENFLACLHGLKSKRRMAGDRRGKGDSRHGFIAEHIGESMEEMRLRIALFCSFQPVFPDAAGAVSRRKSQFLSRHAKRRGTAPPRQLHMRFSERM